MQLILQVTLFLLGFVVAFAIGLAFGDNQNEPQKCDHAWATFRNNAKQGTARFYINDKLTTLLGPSGSVGFPIPPGTHLFQVCIKNTCLPTQQIQAETCRNVIFSLSEQVVAPTKAF